MSETELHGSDKIYSKMMRDGLCEENITQGITERVSSEKADFEYNKRGAESEYQKYMRETFRDATEGRVENARERRAEKKAEREEKKEEKREKKRATYESDEKPEKEYEKETEIEYSKKTRRVAKKANNVADKRNRAFQKAPKIKKLHFENKRNFRNLSDREYLLIHPFRQSGTRLHFENRKQMRKQDYNFDKLKKVNRRERRKVQRKNFNQTQQKLYKKADDNVSIEASNKGLRFGRKTWRKLRRGKDKLLDPYLNPVDRYYRFEKKAVKLNSKASYLKFMDENSKHNSKNLFKKELQKRRFKKKFAETYRRTQDAQYASHVAQAFVVKSSRRAAETIKRVKKILAACGGTGVLIILLIFLLFSCTMVITNNVGVQSGTIYPAENLDITNADGYYTEKEADLQDLLNHVEETHSGYDEYQYHLDSIGHDTTALLSYLSVVFEDFTLEQVQPKLDSIFEEQYKLSFREEVQIRERTVHDSVTGKSYTETYEWHILHVTLVNNDLKKILKNSLPDESSRERFDIYNDVDGGRQILGNPFDFNWSNSISSPFGWRIHPISGEKKFHTGIDIAEPAGTPIKAVMTGTVVIAKYSDSAGNYVGIQDKDGYLTKYMHCLSINVSEGDEVKKGDVIGKVGSTGNSTGNHLHLDVIDPNGNYLNPYFMVSHYIKEVDRSE